MMRILWRVLFWGLLFFILQVVEGIFFGVALPLWMNLLIVFGGSYVLRKLIF